ncbi:MAG: UpxY family transcription antiterminator [Bacteroidales bacterium]|nr:UpxY family transcription antiterminator [Bacteroidales bacterium]
MEEVVKLAGRQQDENPVSAECSVLVHPEVEKSNSGKSVGYAPQPEVRYWFPIRATYHRAQKVYDRLVALGNDRLEPYLPTLCRVEEDENTGNSVIKEEPLDKSLLFVRTTFLDFRKLLENPLLIPGLTPYYNHFKTNGFGKNELLTVPDRQMESFKIIVESRNQNIIVRQSEVPKIIEGDRVVVTDGAFAGVEGVVMKYKHQKRVFVQLHGVGIYATAYVPGAWLKKIDN